MQRSIRRQIALPACRRLLVEERLPRQSAQTPRALVQRLASSKVGQFKGWPLKFSLVCGPFVRVSCTDLGSVLCQRKGQGFACCGTRQLFQNCVRRLDLKMKGLRHSPRHCRGQKKHVVVPGIAPARQADIVRVGRGPWSAAVACVRVWTG